jgi:hypothetical protein
VVRGAVGGLGVSNRPRFVYCHGLGLGPFMMAYMASGDWIYQAIGYIRLCFVLLSGVVWHAGFAAATSGFGFAARPWLPSAADGFARSMAKSAPGVAPYLAQSLSAFCVACCPPPRWRACC